MLFCFPRQETGLRLAAARRDAYPALFVDQAAGLIKVLKTKSADDISALMSLSPALSELNVQRYASWKRSFTQANSRQAVLAFNGDVYEGWTRPRCRPSSWTGRRNTWPSSAACTACCVRWT